LILVWLLTAGGDYFRAIFSHDIDDNFARKQNAASKRFANRMATPIWHSCRFAMRLSNCRDWEAIRKHIRTEFKPEEQMWRKLPWRTKGQKVKKLVNAGVGPAWHP
jgi:hypothetical protein